MAGLAVALGVGAQPVLGAPAATATGSKGQSGSAPTPVRRPASQANSATVDRSAVQKTGAPSSAPKDTSTASTTGAPTKAPQPDAAAKAAAKAPSATATRESEIYGDRLEGLQTEIDDLKDRVFRSRARLALLRETVLKGVMAGSRIVVAHRNLMGSGFRLVRILFILDGAQIYARTDESGGLDSEDELVIYDGNLPPGPHNVTIEMTYKGNGYGVFSYLTGYTFESRSSHSFTAPENGALKLSSLGYERGNLTTEMGERPSVRWTETPLDAAGRPVSQGRGRKGKSEE